MSSFQRNCHVIGSFWVNLKIDTETSLLIFGFRRQKRIEKSPPAFLFLTNRVFLFKTKILNLQELKKFFLYFFFASVRNPASASLFLHFYCLYRNFFFSLLMAKVWYLKDETRALDKQAKYEFRTKSKVEIKNRVLF